MVLSIYLHNPEPAPFERLVKLLHRLGFRFISLSDLSSQLLERRFKHRRQVFVSFDDGWRDNLKLLPIIEKYQVPVTIFVTVNTMTEGTFWWEYILKTQGYDALVKLKAGDYDILKEQVRRASSELSLPRSAITVDELKFLSRNRWVTIGSHTMSHPLLDKLDDADMVYEITESKRILSDLCGYPITAFSYPNGNFTSREVKTCNEVYSVAFTTKSYYIHATDSLHQLPRICLTGNLMRDILKMLRIWPIIKRVFKH